ncbi:MAG: Gfo/Idh/MocA family oxidoreductase [Planctomycetes bacterium]|nr:Gfo/Idh/MocA family oxidoreductase [Planctomycetota bacterium]
MLDIAVVGIGQWGRNVLRNFAALSGVRIRTLVETNRARHEELLRQHPGSTVTDNLEEALGDPAVKAVAVTVPSVHHFSVARRALEAGKHVFVEKPLALTVAHGEELVALAAARRLRLMVGHLLLYHPAVVRLRELMQQPSFGHAYYIYSQRVNLGVVRQDENAWWSLAPHDVAVVLHLTGQKPKWVSTTGHAYLQPSVEDVVFAAVGFENGAMAHMHVSWLDPHKIRKITVVGNRQMLVFDDMETSEKLRVYSRDDRTRITYENYADLLQLRLGDIHIPKVDMMEPLRAECAHFVECVENDREPVSSGASALDVLRILQAGSESLLKCGAPIPISRQAHP